MNAAIRTLPSEHAAKPFIAPKLFTAKRFADTRNLSQAEWLEIRRQGIGDCGLNPYMSMLELWIIKTG